MRKIGRAAAVMLGTLLLAAPAAAATPVAATIPTARTTAARSTAAAHGTVPMATVPTVVYGFGSYGFGSLHATVRPERIAFGMDGTHYITELKWNRWRSTGAEAVGRYHIDDCVPNCARGRYHVYRVIMLLSRVLTQHGRSYFAGMTLRWTQSKATVTRALSWGTHGGKLAFWG
ncbi:MAG TPA: hypothetical protein VMC03_19265 [Streptosporangiaceae bacterium]|nr:hypothetical protein [Streptosporangiaceae bacterium]